MKGLCFFGIVFSVLMVCLPVRAFENLDEWTNDYYDGNGASFTHNGTSVTASSAGSTSDYGFGLTGKYFDHSLGCTGKVKINSGDGVFFAGLRQDLGTNSEGNYLLAEVMLFKFQDEYSARYRVRIRDKDTFETIEIIAYGWLGNYTGGWDFGREVLIGFALIGDKLCFYTPQTETFVLVKTIDDLNPFTGTTNIMIYAAENSNVNATISDVTMLYPNDLGVFSQAVEKPKAVVIPLD